MNRRLLHSLLTAVAVAALLLGCQPAPPEPPEEGMVPFFDGKTLDGLEIKNGKATYEVIDGMIVGTTAEGSPNSFLCPTREYGDFIMEFEVMTDPVLNSGVQIRSHQYETETEVVTMGNRGPVTRKHPAGRIHGLQVEIANEESGASGGIYDEARRGWVANIADDPVASKAFKDNQWNHYRIEAIGDHVKVFVNGVPCADLIDSVDLKGLIGLQVHSFKGDQPAQVRWRNLWIKDLGEHVWEPIFDGQTLNGWEPIGGGKWEVVDGAIRGTNNANSTRGLLFYTAADHEDVTVRLQFKAVKSNSGVFFRTKADGDKVAGYEAEVDEAKHIGGLFEVGGRKWVVQPSDEEVAKYFRPGEWNEMTVAAKGQRVVIRVNGIKTAEVQDDPGPASGKLALQIHAQPGAEVWFKDIAVLKKK